MSNSSSATGQPINPATNSVANPKPVLPKAMRIQAKLVRKISLTHDVIELHFVPEPAFTFVSGQFVSILVPGAGPGGRDLRRAYSIASEPELDQKTGLFELCVKLVEGGPGTTFLNSLTVGQSMTAMAPYGDFVYKPKPNQHVVMIATGTGIAPFRSMIKSNLFKANPPASAVLLFGARTLNDLLYTDELKKYLGSDHFIQTLSQAPATDVVQHGRVTDYLRKNSEKIHWKTTDFYLCGNGAMIDEIKKILSEHGVEKNQIHQEVYYKPKLDG
jgi:ferredoxin-NADP reductase